MTARRSQGQLYNARPAAADDRALPPPGDQAGSDSEALPRRLYNARPAAGDDRALPPLGDQAGSDSEALPRAAL